MSDTEDKSGDILNILIASDIHLGYAEKDPIRGEDSFVTFEEILNIGVKREVDLILLGGDLFHDAKPSQKCLHEATRLLRRYCMGDKPVPIEFLSDQSENFQHCVNPVVNYEDPNLNVAIPVFSIHGNHDDPTGLGRLSTLDLLSVSGLVNYFGKWTDLKQIKISPLLMRKGKTKLALYGLSYIKDERLSRLFRDRKVQLFQPKEATNEWFNIFVLHQNRADRGPNNCLPEDALPNFLDVVLWGHEHECRIIPEENPTQHFKVIQPGSPVATSLCEGEAKTKHVGILKIYKKKYELEPIKLKTVRPFLMDTITLSKSTINYVSDKISEATQNHVRDHIAHLIEKSKVQITGHRKQPELPLIRLRVEYNDEKQVFNPLKFGLQFSTQVANPRDIVLLKKERAKRDIKDSADLDKDTLKEIIERANETEKIETLVEKYFTDVDPNKTLQVLSIKGLNEALSHYIEKSDTEAISDLINHQVKRTAEFLKENVTDVDNIKEALENYRAIRTANKDDVVKEAQRVLSGRNRKSANNGVDNLVTISDDDDDDDSDTEVRPSTSTSSARGRGRGRGRGSRGGKQASETTRATSGSRGGSRGKKPLDVTKTLLSNTSRSSSGRKIKQMDFSDSD